MKAAFTAATAAIVVALAAAASASAGTYDVYACDSAHGGGSPSWGAAVDPGFTAYTECPGGQGIVARTVWDNGYSGFLQGGYQIFDAPPGTTIDSFHGYVKIQRPDCNWGVGILASNGDLTGTALWYLFAGQCGVYGIDWHWVDLGVNASRVRIEARCGAGSCYRGQSNSSLPPVAETQIRDVRVTVRDDGAPSLTSGGGQLWTSAGWLGGTQDISFDASDASGIQLADVQVDGNRIRADAKPCDFTQRIPCPGGGYAGTIDTATIRPDGAHTLTLEAVDAAGNPGTVSRTVYVDNTAPAAPSALTVVGGDGWRASNAFDLQWTNPPADGAAPIAGAEYRLCPASGGPCVRGSRTGKGMTSINALQVPAAGDWTLQLWLRDAAGNQDSRYAAQLVHLRYDDAAPSVAFEPQDATDPTLLRAQVVDGTSGVAQAQIEFRRKGTEVWRPLPTTLVGQDMTARIPDEELANGTYELRGHAVDAAGNERTSELLANGQLAMIRLPVRLGTRFQRVSLRRRHGRAVRMASRVRVNYGRTVRVRGRLATAQGSPLPEVDLAVYSQARRPGAGKRLVATLKTSRSGRFSYRAPRGVSRTITFRYAGTPTVEGATQDIAVLVRAHSTLRTNAKRFLNGETARFHGRLSGRSIPPGGKLIELQVILRGSWHTFATVHTNGHGRWHYDYRFDGTRGHQRYRFRVSIPEEADYPFATGHSNAIMVEVRGL
jgi:hypothetical protein